MENLHDSQFWDDPDFQSLLVPCLESLQRGETIDREALAKDFPKYAGEVGLFLKDRQMLEQAAAEFSDIDPSNVPISAYEQTVGTHPCADGLGEGDRVRYIGEYEILKEIARGGMGIVFKARQQQLNRIVALKMILAGKLADAADVERFHREAQAAGRLKHPSIVPVHEIGQHEGRHYFTMDFVDGRSLAEEIREESLAPRRAAEIVKTAAEAVHFAHDKGTVHRDLKPANVLLTNGVSPHITDFGLAKMIDAVDETSRAELTASGQILGTPSYMSPEQASGNQALVGPGSDIYSLGAILYACLTGRAPFVADSPVDTLLQVMGNEPVAPRTLNPSVPRDLETICLKCLRKEPHHRYGTAQQLADDLRPDEGEPDFRGWEWSYYLDQTEQAAHNLGISEKGEDVDWSPDGTMIATASSRLEVWDAKTGGLLHQANLGQWLNSVTWNPDNNRLAVGFSQGDAGVYDLKARRVLKQWKAHDSKTWSIDWSPAGDRVATGSLDGGAAVWNGEIGELVHRLMPNQNENNKNYLRKIDWNPRDELVAVSHRDGYVRVFDAESGELKFKRRACGISCNLCAWSADGQLLAGGGCFPNNEIIFYTTAGERTGAIKTTSRDGQWSPDGKRFATGGDDHDVTIWNVETKEVEHTLRFHSAPVKRLAWSPDSQRLVSVGDDGTARVWNLDSDTAASRVIHSGPAAARMVVYSPDGQWIAGACADKSLRVWEASTGKLIHNFDSHTAAVKDLSWSGDSRQMVSICGNNTVWLWDLQTGESRRTIKPTLTGGGVHPGVAWQPGTNSIALGELADRSRTYDALTGNFLNEGPTWAGHGRWSHDGQLLAQPNVTVLNENLQSVTGVKLPTNACYWLSWSPNDRLLTCGGQDGRLRVVDLISHKVLGVGEGHGDTIGCVAWHPGGTRIASGGPDGKIILRDAATLDVVWSVQLPARVLSLDWSPDGKHLVSSHGQDGQSAAKEGEPLPEVRIWGSPQITPPSQETVMLNTAIAQTLVPGLRHREVATQILNAGGAVMISQVAEAERIERLIDLPATSFHIIGIDLTGVAMDEALLEELSAGLVINEINVRETGLTDAAVRDLVRSLRNVKELDFDTSRREFQIDEDGMVTEVLSQQEELAELTLAIEQGPKPAHHWRERGIWYGEHLQWEKACEDFAKFHALNVSHSWGHVEAARAALMAGDQKAYHVYMQVNLGNLSKFDLDREKSTGAYLARTMVLWPETVKDWDIAKKLVEQHSETDPSFYGTKGVVMVALRMGQPQRVLDRLDSFEPLYINQQERVLYHALRALAQFQLGNKPAAQEELEMANNFAAEQWTAPDDGELPTYGNFNTYPEGTVFLREALELIRLDVLVPEEAVHADTLETSSKFETTVLEQSLTDQQ